MKQGRTAQPSKSANPAPKTAPAKATFESKPPLKPHRGLFVGLLIVLAGWIGVLLWLFFTTVWPLRHSISTTRTALP